MYQINEIKKIVKAPGVYRFFSAKNELLYIGKAKILKNRISSYFNKNGDNRPLIAQMVSQISQIEIIKTDSEIEAIILEAELIRKLLPKYNIRLRDDKTFLMIKITKEEFPRILISRYKDYDNKDKTADYFGPYTSSDSLKKALKILRKIFLFADCNENKFNSYNKQGRSCLYGMIKNCQSPCINSVSKEKYQQDLKYLKYFLRGKKRELLKIIEEEMKKAASLKEFEKAAELRNKLSHLSRLNQTTVMANEETNALFTSIKRIEAYDISNIQGQLAVGSMTVIIDGNLDKDSYRRFKIKTVVGPNDPAMIYEIIKRRLNNNWPKPDLIVIDGGQSQFFAASKALTEKKLSIKLLAVAKGSNRKKDEFIYDDAGLAKLLKKDENLNRLIKLCRDEAHRFAISYFHKRQVKDLLNKE